MTPPVKKKQRFTFCRQAGEDEQQLPPSPSPSPVPVPSGGLLDPQVLQLLVLTPGKSRSFLTTKEVGTLCLRTSKSLQKAVAAACIVFDKSSIENSGHDATNGSSSSATAGNSGDGDGYEDIQERSDTNSSAGASGGGGGGIGAKIQEGNTLPAIFDINYFWRCLCINYYRGNEISLLTLMDKTGMSAKKCFHACLLPNMLPARQRERPPSPPPPPPLKYTPSDYVMIVQACGSTELPGHACLREAASGDSVFQHFLFCETLEGDIIPEFFDRGSSNTVLLKQPVSYGILRETDHYNPGTFVYFRGKVQLMRKRDGKIVDLFCSKDVMSFDGEDSGMDYESESREQEVYIPSTCSRWMLEEMVGWGGEDSMRLSIEPKFTYEAISDSNEAACSILGFRISLELSDVDGVNYPLRDPDPADWLSNGYKFAHFIESMPAWDS